MGNLVTSVTDRLTGSSFAGRGANGSEPKSYAPLSSDRASSGGGVSSGGIGGGGGGGGGNSSPMGGSGASSASASSSSSSASASASSSQRRLSKSQSEADLPFALRTILSVSLANGQRLHVIWPQVKAHLMIVATHRSPPLRLFAVEAFRRIAEMVLSQPLPTPLSGSSGTSGSGGAPPPSGPLATAIGGEVVTSAKACRERLPFQRIFAVDALEPAPTDAAEPVEGKRVKGLSRPQRAVSSDLSLQSGQGAGPGVMPGGLDRSSLLDPLRAVAEQAPPDHGDM